MNSLQEQELHRNAALISYGISFILAIICIGLIDKFASRKFEAVRNCNILIKALVYVFILFPILLFSFGAICAVISRFIL